MRKWLPFLALPLVAGTCKSKPPDPMYSWEPARAACEGEGYSSVAESSFASPMEQPLSTFSVDVDTASYSNVRRFLQDGQAPPADAVRIEELLNTFEYDDPAPEDGAPFAVRAEVADCPWAPGHQLVRLGLQARRVLVEQATGTLLTVARDVKVQVEFNPREVSSYRLIGYDNRLLAARDFNDTQTDAGEIGAGHHVTALYEIVPPGAAAIPGVDPLRYQAAPAPQAPPAALSTAAESGELMQVKIRYKNPEGGDGQPLVFPVLAGSQPVAHASESWRWAAAVAAWGMLLRDSAYRGEADWALVRELASGARGLDPDGYRAEFLRLIELSATLTPSPGG